MTFDFLSPFLNFSEMDNKMVKNESFYKACRQTGICSKENAPLIMNSAFILTTNDWH